MIYDLTEEDIEKVLIISDKYVGKNFQTFEIIKDYILNERKIVKVYKIDGEIIGFVKGEILEKSQLKGSLLKTNSSLEDKLKGEGEMGVAETIFVKEEYRGQRIAQQLTEDLIESFKKKENIDSIVAIVWKSSDGANAKKLVENIGFKYITEIPDYWYLDSEEKNYFCPICGKPPCKCSMILYKL